jgi:serine O-acetyltransferase
MGVVIGETAEIGDNVTLYHGVTLGGTSLQKGKRHPTLENEVVVGAGAKILGAIIVGEGSRIGANAVVNKAVPPNSVVVGVPGQVVLRSKPRSADAPPDLNHNVLPDTIGLTVADLMKRLERVEGVLSGQVDDHPLASNMEKLEKLEISLKGHLFEHSYVLGNGDEAQHSHKANGHSKSRTGFHADHEHSPHIPEAGLWRGEDFSI